MVDTFFEEISEAGFAAPARPGLYARGGKRLFDVAVVMLILPVVLPVILLTWTVIFFREGSGFYCQPRVGRGGKAFDCWKIRTMAVDAEQKLAIYLQANPAAAQEWHRTQKLANDPRITKFGHFLRASSIDELPQLWNVLKGEMSLIGPRPFTPNQKALYDAASPRRSYYTLRPGVSGLWQIRSRNAGEFCDRVTFDEEYAAKIGLIFDIKIAICTIGVVLRATGK